MLQTGVLMVADLLRGGEEALLDCTNGTAGISQAGNLCGRYTGVRGNDMSEGVLSVARAEIVPTEPDQHLPFNTSDVLAIGELERVLICDGVLRLKVELLLGTDLLGHLHHRIGFGPVSMARKFESNAVLTPERTA